MSRPWLLAIFALLASIALAHAPTFLEVWTGEASWSQGIDRCPGSFALREAPGTRITQSDESCDTIYSQRMGWDSWRRAVETWEARPSTVHFLVYNLWTVATSARALNILDLILFMWPARLLLGPAAGMATLHLTMLVLAALSGVILARSLRLSALAGLAAGTVLGGSGLVIEATTRGQYPQAILLGYCLFFAGLARVVKGERLAVPLLAGGLALSTLFYWINGLILGLGAVVFLLATPFDRAKALRVAPPLLVAGIIAVIVCLPAAIPVIQSMAAGNEEKMVVVPWGTAYPTGGTRDALADLIDEVPWFTQLDPRLGWLPALPLLPFTVVGLARRERLPWLVVVVFGCALALGPFPPAPWGSQVFEGYGTLPRGGNPLYTFIYQWFPLASRMHHPMRWAGLASVALAAATAYGVDAMRTRWSDHAIIGVIAGLLWTTWVGPWPLPKSDFPQELYAALDHCEGIVLPAEPPGSRELDDIHRLEGLLWVPRAPASSKGSGGVGAPTKAITEWSALRVEGLQNALDGKPLTGPDPLLGMCILYESRWVRQNTQNVREQLVTTFGPPAQVITATGLFAVDGTTRRIEVFRGERKPLP